MNTIPHRRGGAVVATILLTSGSAVLAQRDPPQVDWVRANAIKFSGVEAEKGFEDLQPLKAMIGEARVVGLGEATHGTREHFQLKHRLMEFLASEMGFTIFSIEASMPEACRVDRFVSRGEGDPAALIGGMYFWTWNTEEVLEMVQWMRRLNQAQADRHIRFTGFDMQAPDYAQTLVTRFVAAHDAAFTNTLEEKWKAVTSISRRSTGGFACTSVLLPIDEVRGKNVRLSGFVRCEGVSAADWAGLWARVNAGKEVRFFDNMSSQAVRGTRDWAEYSIAFEVAADATAVQIGTVMSGNGKSWYDDLKVEVEGKELRHDSIKDLDFEEGALGSLQRGFALELFDPGKDVYRVETVDGEAHAGRRSLVMVPLNPIEAGAPSASEVRGAAQEVYDHLAGARDQYIKAGASAVETDWAIQNARIVVQATNMFKARDGSALRDESMAQNVMWLLEQNPKAKIVLWAHNYHISTRKPWMGSHLREQLGDQYVAVGFMAGEGTYYAMPASRDAKKYVHTLQEAPPYSVEWFFHQTERPFAMLDLRLAKEGSAGSSWVFENTPFGGTIGAMQEDERFDSIKVRDAFDILLYVDKTTPAKQLKTPPSRTAPKD